MAPGAGSRGWVAVTHDRRIRSKPNELAAVIEHRVALIVVIGQAPFSDLARSFVATRSQIQRFVTANTPPFIAKCYRAAPTDLARNPTAPGRIERWHP